MILQKQNLYSYKPISVNTLYYMVAERAQRAANRKKHLQIKKTTSSIWQHTCCKCSQHKQSNALQMLITQPNKETQIKLFIWLCCEHLQCVSLFVLWAFAAPAVKLMKMFNIAKYS